MANTREKKRKEEKKLARAASSALSNSGSKAKQKQKQKDVDDVLQLHHILNRVQHTRARRALLGRILRILLQVQRMQLLLFLASMAIRSRQANTSMLGAQVCLVRIVQERKEVGW